MVHLIPEVHEVPTHTILVYCVFLCSSDASIFNNSFINSDTKLWAPTVINNLYNIYSANQQIITSMRKGTTSLDKTYFLRFLFTKTFVQAAIDFPSSIGFHFIHLATTFFLDNLPKPNQVSSNLVTFIHLNARHLKNSSNATVELQNCRRTIVSIFTTINKERFFKEARMDAVELQKLFQNLAFLSCLEYPYEAIWFNQYSSFNFNLDLKFSHQFDAEDSDPTTLSQKVKNCNSGILTKDSRQGEKFVNLIASDQLDDNLQVLASYQHWSEYENSDIFRNKLRKLEMKVVSSFEQALQKYTNSKQDDASVQKSVEALTGNWLCSADDQEYNESSVCRSLLEWNDSENAVKESVVADRYKSIDVFDWFQSFISPISPDDKDGIKIKQKKLLDLEFIPHT